MSQHIHPGLPLFLILISFSLSAQTPLPVQFDSTGFGKIQVLPGQRSLCNDAGTVNVALKAGAQSNDVAYLCYCDSLLVNHNNDADLSGDPQSATPPGIGYAFYNCPPNIAGDNLATVVLDPCLIKTPTPPNNGLWITTQQIDGDATFYNKGQIQKFFNGGKPIRIFYAPITVDDFATNGYEKQGAGPAGPCVNVNTADFFPVVYLNEIRIDNRKTSGLNGSFVPKGGLPEFTGVNYTITIALQGNPGIKGTVTSGPSAHDKTVTFTVPQPGTYVVTVQDGKNCKAVGEMYFTGVNLSIDCVPGEEGKNVCLNFSVENYQSIYNLEFTVLYDPAVLDYTNYNFLAGLGGSFDVFEVQPGELKVVWFTTNLLNGDNLPDGTQFFSLCFDVTGTAGDLTLVSLDNSQDIIAGTIDMGGNPVNLGINQDDGCISVFAAGQLDVQLIQDSTTCKTDKDGGFTVTANGGLPPYSFQWESVPPGTNGNGVINLPGGSATVSGLGTGIYSVTIQDANQPANTVTKSVQVFSLSDVGVSMQLDPPTCFNATDGAANAIVTQNNIIVGNTTNYTFTWNPAGPNSPNFDDVKSGFYAVTVTDPFGCSATASGTMSQPAPLTLNIQAFNPDCGAGSSNGAIIANASGGTIKPSTGCTDYTYVWSAAGGNANQISGLTVGNYYLTVTDCNFCTLKDTITLSTAQGPQIVAIDSTAILCHEGFTGSLTLTVIQGAAAITSYSWKNATRAIDFSGNPITNIPSGLYLITVTDANGCFDVESFSLSNPEEIRIDSVITSAPLCPGLNNGSVGVAVSGGTSPYTYTWSTNNIPGSFSVLPNLVAGNYTVSVTDKNNCPAVIQNITLNDPPAIQLAFTNVKSTKCANSTLCDGSATVSAKYSDNTNGSFNFLWSSGESKNASGNSTAVALCSGTQSVTVSDGTCFVVGNVDIQAPPPLDVSIEGMNVSCNGLNDGMATALVSGGTPPYTYAWNNSAISPKISNLGPGQYIYTVTDANGCSGLFSVSITEPTPFAAVLNNNETANPSCAGTKDGVISVLYTGGNPGTILFTWTNGISNAEKATGLGPGIYSVTLTDSGGCTATVTHALTAPPPVTGAIIPPVEPKCFGYQTSVQVLTAGGGSGGPYFFSIDGSSQVPITDSIPVYAGLHEVVIYDKNGCGYKEVISISEPPEIAVDLGPPVEIKLGSSANLVPFINAAIDSFFWSPPNGLSCTDCYSPETSTQDDIVYTLQVFDAQGCTGKGSIVVTVDNNRNVFIPNAFSPNGDGYNDIFAVQTGLGVELITNMVVFDRWGEQMYEGKDIAPTAMNTVGWDGRHRGQLMDQGVFVYLVEVRFIDGVTLLYRGDVTLLR